VPVSEEGCIAIITQVFPVFWVAVGSLIILLSGFGAVGMVDLINQGRYVGINRLAVGLERLCGLASLADCDKLAVTRSQFIPCNESFSGSIFVVEVFCTQWYYES
jgi:hypothetical protein